MHHMRQTGAACELAAGRTEGQHDRHDRRRDATGRGREAAAAQGPGRDPRSVEGRRGGRRPRTRAGSGGERLTAAGMLPAKWWDERVPGGSVKGWLFLVHPGPSLLVTATFVAVAALAARSAPSPLRVAQLAAAMLCVQFAIGIANDLADVAPDSLSKPYKPLARVVVPRPAAAI